MSAITCNYFTTISNRSQIYPEGAWPRKLVTMGASQDLKIFNRVYFRPVFVKGASSSPLKKKKKEFIDRLLCLLHFLQAFSCSPFLQLHPQKEDISVLKSPCQLIIPSNTLFLYFLFQDGVRSTSKKTTGVNTLLFSR